MKYLRQYIRQILKENVSSDTLIIVDVQPAYESNTPFDIGEMLEYLGDYDQADEMVYELDQKSEFFDKGYGFFRDLMDDDRCYPRQHIVKIVKYMLDNDVNMLYDLTEEQFAQIDVPDLLFDELQDYGFNIPELADELPNWDGADIVGGDEDECMAEVLILGTAQRLSFNKIPKYIY